MIARAAAGLLLVGIILPRHPDLGLPVAGASPAYANLLADDHVRESIFRRLRDVRREIRAGAGKKALIDPGIAKR